MLVTNIFNRIRLQKDKVGKFLNKKDVQSYFKLVANLSEYTTDPKNASLLLDVISPILYRSTKTGNSFFLSFSPLSF